MKMFRMLSIALVCVVPQFANAANPTTATEVLVALTDELKTFCSRVDHGGAGRIEDQLARLLKGLHERDLEQARHSADYKTAHQTYESVFNDLPTDLGAQLCQAVAANGAHDLQKMGDDGMRRQTR